MVSVAFNVLPLTCCEIFYFIFYISMSLSDEVSHILFMKNITGLCVFVYVVAAVAMLIPVFMFEFWWVFSSFLVLEAMVGMFNSCGATLRSRYYPEGLQSSIMSVFRLPLNLLVVVGTKLTDKADDIPSLQTVFGVLACMHIVAMALQVGLQYFKAQADSAHKTTEVNKRKVTPEKKKK